MTPNDLQADGWTTRILDDGFNEQLSPLWIKGKPGARTVGFFVEKRHTNGHMGTLHGGALMTFADIALGWLVVDSLGEPRCATAQLQTYFVAVARVGEFVSCTAEMVRQTRDMIFVRGLIKVDDKTIANCDGIWKVLPKRDDTSKVG